MILEVTVTVILILFNYGFHLPGCPGPTAILSDRTRATNLLKLYRARLSICIIWKGRKTTDTCTLMRLQLK
eukprot:g3305.t1